MHKALNHVLQGVRKEEPKDQVCSLYTPYCLPYCLTPFLPLPDECLPIFLHSQVTDSVAQEQGDLMGSITDSQNKGENIEVKTLVHALQLLFKLFCFPFSSEHQPHSHSVLSSQT